MPLKVRRGQQIPWCFYIHGGRPQLLPERGNKSPLHGWDVLTPARPCYIQVPLYLGTMTFVFCTIQWLEQVAPC